MHRIWHRKQVWGRGYSPAKQQASLCHNNRPIPQRSRLHTANHVFNE